MTHTQIDEDRRYIAGILALAAAFTLIKALGPAFTERLLSGGKTLLLNRLTGASGIQTIDFYIGRMEEALWGPLAAVFSGMALTLFCLWKQAVLSTRRYLALIVVFLLVTKWDILFYPPYGDAVASAFAEGVWLLKNNFNYAALAQQPNFVQGGPRTYLYSLYPGYVALLMRAIPSAKTFLAVNHLIVFVWGAATVAYFRKTIEKCLEAKTALLLSLLLLFLPLFQSQVEQLNMEMPTLMSVMFSVYFLTKKNFGWATFFAVLASMIKGYAVYVGGAVFIVAVGTLIVAKDPKRWKRDLAWGLGNIVFIVLFFMIEKLTFQMKGKVKFVGLWEGWPTIRTMPLTYFYLLSVILLGHSFIKDAFLSKTILWREWLGHHRVPLILNLLCAGWFAVFLQSYAVSHRYRLHLAPFIFFCIFYALTHRLKKRKAVTLGLIVILVLSNLFAYGMNYKAADGVLESLLERSLEYRNDLRLHMKISRRMEEKFSDWLIVAPFTMAQSLAIPEIGYVATNLNVMIYSYPCLYGNIKNFNGLRELNLKRTVWIGLAEPPMPFPYPLGPRDVLIEQIYSGNRKGVIFLGGTAIEGLRLLILQMAREGTLRPLYNPSKQ